MVLLIDSVDDPRLDQFRLRERELRPRRIPARMAKGMTPADLERVSAGHFVAEGDLVVERALAAGCEPVALLTDAEAPAAVASRMPSHVPVFAARAEARRMLTGLGVALDVIGLFERPPTRAVDDMVPTSRHLLLAEDVDNPTNIGAIARSAAAFGVDGLILDRNSADPLARRALRVSMGTALHMRHARVDDIPSIVPLLRTHGFVVCGLTPRSTAEDIAEVGRRLPASARVAIVLGAERDGLSERTLAALDHSVRIPMAPGIDSLNVAAAAAVACHSLLARTLSA